MITEKEYKKIKNVPSYSGGSIELIRESIEKMRLIQRETENKLMNLLF